MWNKGQHIDHYIFAGYKGAGASRGFILLREMRLTKHLLLIGLVGLVC